MQNKKVKFWIGCACAETPMEGEIVDLLKVPKDELLIKLRARGKFRPVVFTAPTYNEAYKGLLEMSRIFYPVRQGFINHNVQSLVELNPLETVINLISQGAVTLLELEGVIQTERKKRK
jgi:hypothetical protein